MAAPTKLILEFNDIDAKFHVNDKNGFAFGDGYEPVDAIKHARVVTNAPIDIGESCGLPNICVAEKPDDAIADAEVFISALAEIGGMEVTKVFDDNMNFVGYTMKPVENDSFLDAETLAEEYENDILAALDPYVGDD